LTCPEPPSALAERLGPGQEIAALREEVVPVSREPHAATDAIEEPDAELALELADLAPEGGLAQAELRGRLGEPPRVGDRHEVANVSEVHAAYASRVSTIVGIMQWTQDGPSP
jgi:hypothetical protein